MDLGNIAAQLLQEKLGSKVDSNQANSALEGLLGGGGLGDLVSKLSQGGLAEQAQSWLGDGSNASVSPEQIMQNLDISQIKGFADKLGLDEGGAADLLSNFLPGLIDKSSAGGDLLEKVGGISGLAGLAKKFF